ncbi:MAG: T9SS type A sorting domain-containing protein [Bacteroidota bacterium]|nr:T9SS type A sorting domain-containing protein [Bacteroidota bacterium]
MKKLFTLFAIIPMIAWGQTQILPAHKFIKMTPTTDAVFPNPAPKSTTSNKTSSANSAAGSTTIGHTEYDLQSNAAVARRIIQLPGNKISIVWTTASDASPWPSRGSGYNHYNGTTWLQTDLNLTKNRIESQRVGWPNLGVITENGTTQEFVLAHNVSTTGLAGGFMFSKNGGIGNGSFAGSVVLDDTYNATVSPGPIWGRSATLKNKIFLIGTFSDSNATQPKTFVKSGVRGPTVYSIYDATSKTWTVKNETLPGYDSVRYTRGNGDEYAVDANDNIISYVIGGIADDLALWKSSDEGQNWTKVIIDSFNRALPVPNGSDVICNNGSVHVIVDKNDITHVFYPILALSYDSITLTDTVRYYKTSPTINGIVHWMDKIDPNTNTYYPASIIGQAVDIDADQALTFQANARNLNYGGYGQSLNFSSTNVVSAVVSQPSASIDDSGIIYVTYVSLVELDENTGDEENFRDIYCVYSRDGGLTWSTPLNITNTIGIEECYPAQTRLADNSLHITYQEKTDPGSFVTSGTNNPSQTCDIKYWELPTASIKKGNVGIAKVENNLFSIGQNQPNPFKEITFINLDMKQAGKVNFAVTNLIGQQVYTNTYNYSAGKQTIEFNGSSLAPGIYIYTLASNGQSTSRRMIVK